MPELPEIYHIAGQMDSRLRGRRIVEVDIKQDKCLNVPPEEFRRLIVDKAIEGVQGRGKWLLTRFADGAHLMISLGMGGDIIYHPPGEPFEGKYQVRLDLDDRSYIHVYFSWFGYAHAASAADLPAHRMTAQLGACPLSPEFTLDRFRAMLAGKKGGIKSYLMDQHNIAGIGNVYIQDILFQAKLHPNRKINAISDQELERLHQAIVSHLGHAASLGGLKWERDFYGQHGRYQYELVGHRPGTACPECGATVEEIRTGSTRSFICPSCQV
jgi:formamidopyrimidine-DNA glycosylase